MVMITVNKSNKILKVATGGDTVNITNAYEDNRLIIISFLFILMIMVMVRRNYMCNDSSEF